MTMNLNGPPGGMNRQLTVYAIVGMGVIVALVGGLLVWSMTAQISAAAVAPGVLRVDGEPVAIQSERNGTVSDILVESGETVTAGQKLVQLDDSDIRAQLLQIGLEHDTQLLRAARLSAQNSGAATFELPAGLLTDSTDADFTAVYAEELEALRLADADLAIRGDLRDRAMAKLTDQQRALEQKLAAAQTRLAQIDAELATPPTEPTTETEAANQELKLERITTAADVQAGENALANLETSIADESQAAELEELASNQELLEAGSAARDQAVQLRSDYSRLELELPARTITAPVAGIAHEVNGVTAGVVLASGQKVMSIVATQGPRTVRAQVPPVDVDKWIAGTDVDVRILSLDVDAAPEVEGKLLRVAPEVSVDQLTGQSYYEAEVRLTAAALSSLPADASLPGGTPVEAHLQLGDRTVLAYLVGPFLERLTKAMREP